MAKKNEWLEDSEALSIAMDVVDKFNDTFCGIDLSRIRFLRILGRKKGKDIFRFDECRIIIGRIGKAALAAFQ